VNPDDLAPYFGYTSGDALVERLGMLTTDRRSAGSLSVIIQIDLLMLKQIEDLTRSLGILDRA